MIGEEFKEPTGQVLKSLRIKTSTRKMAQKLK